MGSFDRGMAAALPVGSVIQSPLNLESMTNGQWIALDGRDCNRSDYPLIQSQFPAGVFTSTARTLASTPAVAVIASGNVAPVGDCFLAGAAAGNCLQASTDGVSWNNTVSGTSWTAATVFPSLILAGTRFIAAPSAGETQPYVSKATATTTGSLISKDFWTATTGGTSTTLTQGLAYGSTANGGSGRTVLVKNGSLATASGIFYLNDGATAWSAASGGSTVDRYAVCWTGQKFLAFPRNSGVMQVSSDGATWADVQLPNSLAASCSVASDGGGTVVLISQSTFDSGYGFSVSKDHGVTWRTIETPLDKFDAGIINGTASIHYQGGRFLFIRAGSVSFSRDGVSWQVAFAPISTVTAVSLKSGVHCFINNSTSAFTVTEDLSKFRLPTYPRYAGSSVISTRSTEYIKVRN